jgi:hypothetical protein
MPAKISESIFRCKPLHKRRTRAVNAAILVSRRLVSGAGADGVGGQRRVLAGRWAGIWSVVTTNHPHGLRWRRHKAADGSVALKGDQFQFVRALFVTIPPVSDELPAGDHAALFLDGANKAVMVGIIDGDWVCARFTAPDSLVNLIIKVGKGEVARAGRPS